MLLTLCRGAAGQVPSYPESEKIEPDTKRPRLVSAYGEGYALHL
jgi:hypothetical protein